MGSVNASRLQRSLSVLVMGTVVSVVLALLWIADQIERRRAASRRAVVWDARTLLAPLHHRRPDLVDLLPVSAPDTRHRVAGVARAASVAQRASTLAMEIAPETLDVDAERVK
jgi:hypothetical protein